MKKVKITQDSTIKDFIPTGFLDCIHQVNDVKNNLISFSNMITGTDLRDYTNAEKNIGDAIDHLCFALNDLATVAGYILTYSILAGGETKFP